jgi:hypothetical protein
MNAASSPGKTTKPPSNSNAWSTMLPPAVVSGNRPGQHWITRFNINNGAKILRYVFTSFPPHFVRDFCTDHASEPVPSAHATRARDCKYRESGGESGSRESHAVDGFEVLYFKMMRCWCRIA